MSPPPTWNTNPPSNHSTNRITASVQIIVGPRGECCTAHPKQLSYRNRARPLCRLRSRNLGIPSRRRIRRLIGRLRVWLIEPLMRDLPSEQDARGAHVMANVD